MTKQILALLVVVACIYTTALSQNDDPVLFTVEDTPVHLSEFNYIYTKTNGKKADFSKASLDEYLDLYVKFKLKVQRAKEMQLDTIPTLQRELEGYRRQLADSYLIDKEVTERLIKEAYERTKRDIDISHIMIEIPKGATPADTLEAYNKAMNVKNRLMKGEDFATLAKTFSADKSAKTNGGNIGYVTALFPNGFYRLETAAYTLKPKEISDPVRTNSGYHIVKVNDNREARGEVEVAHILIRKPSKGKGDPAAAKTKIDSLYTALKGGASFEELAKENSQDKLTSPKGGYIGFFGINRYEKSFENAAFGLTKDDSYSEPIESKVGWHIIKRISKKEAEPYNIAKGRLEGKIKQDARFELAKKAMIERIKKEGNYTANPDGLKTFAASLNEDFLTYKWKAPKEKSKVVLFGLGDTKVNLGEFTDFLGRASRKRIRTGKGADLETAVNDLYADFVNEQVLKYEEQQLEVKYPEFKALMREYEEGILLFEATKMLVWDKASQDTVGLKSFFENKARGKYKWDERAEITQYTVKAAAKNQVEKIKKFAKKNDVAAVLAKFNTASEKLVTTSEKTVEKGRNKMVDTMKWKEGEFSEDTISDKDQSVTFVKIEKIIPQTPKTLKEARGYIVADYQDHLEREWIEELRSDYKVKVNDDIFKSLRK